MLSIGFSLTNGYVYIIQGSVCMRMTLSTILFHIECYETENYMLTLS